MKYQDFRIRRVDLKTTRVLGTMRARLRSLRRQGCESARQQRNRIKAERTAAS